jgi:hypothetical protein
MRVILDFRLLRTAAVCSHAETAERDAPGRDGGNALAGEGAEIILFPKIRRRSPRDGRKPLNRRFAKPARTQPA